MPNYWTSAAPGTRKTVNDSGRTGSIGKRRTTSTISNGGGAGKRKTRKRSRRRTAGGGIISAPPRKRDSRGNTLPGEAKRKGLTRKRVAGLQWMAHGDKRPARSADPSAVIPANRNAPQLDTRGGIRAAAARGAGGEWASVRHKVR